MNLKDINRELCAEVWTSEEILKIFDMVTDIPHRMCGSREEKIVQKRILNYLKEINLETQFQKFKVKSWERGESRLVLHNGRKNIELPCLGMVYSPETSKELLRLEMIDVGEGTPRDVEELGSRLNGRAALFTKTDYRQNWDPPKGYSRYDAVVKKGAAAIINGTHRSPGVCSAETARFKETEPVPSISVSGETAALLAGRSRNGKGKISISLKGKTTDRFSGNIIGCLPGLQKHEEIILGAHLDTFDLCCGASDNGSGATTVLGACRLLSKLNHVFRRTVRFVLFTGEELGRLGSQKYVESRKPADDIGLFFNFDIPVNGGYPALLTMTESNTAGLWNDVIKEMDYYFPVEEIKSRRSDHFSFYAEGIPIIWEIGRQRGTRAPEPLHHTHLDTREKVNPNELREALMMAVKIVAFLADTEKFPFERFEPPSSDGDKFQNG